MDAVSGVASVIAVLQLSAKVVEYINTAAGANKDRRRLRDQVRACRDILQTLKDESDDSEEGKAWAGTIKALEGTDTDAPLARLERVMTLVETKLLKKDGFTESLKWPFREKEVDKLVEALEREKSLLTLALDNNSGRLLQELRVRAKDHTKLLEKLSRLLQTGFQGQQISLVEFKGSLSTIQTAQTGIQGGIGRLIERQDAEEKAEKRAKILAELSSFDHTAKQSGVISRREPGTGAWLLESDEYQDWLNSKNRTLFCPGIPGAGKTTLTSIIIEDLFERYGRDSTVGLAFVYWDHQLTDAQRLEKILRSFLKQLVQRHKDIPDYIEDLFNEDNQPKDISAALRHMIALFKRVFILVDALDECQSHGGCLHRFLAEIFTLQKESGVNLWATSRKIPDIEKKFSGATKLEIRANREDIRRYLQNHMVDLPEFVRSNTEFQHEIATSILNSVDGMFLLAHLHIKSLVGKKSKKSIRATLANLKQGKEAYDYAYRDTMKRIAAQPGDQPQMALDALAWIVCSKRPITIWELEDALAVEDGETSIDPENRTDIHELVSVCAGLVIIEGFDLVRLVHHTTREFFDRTREEWFNYADTMITTTCMTYLSFENSDYEIYGHFFARLYDYAWTYWGDHARSASASSTTKIMEFLEAYAGKFRIRDPHDDTLWHVDVNRWIFTKLHVTAYFGLRYATIELLKREPDPDLIVSRKSLHLATDVYYTPLMLAAWQGHPSVVRILIENNAVVNYIDRFTGNTPIKLAARHGHVAVTQFLMNHGAIIDTKQLLSSHGVESNKTHRTATEAEAIEMKAIGATSIGAIPIDATPIEFAAKHGHEAVVQLLLDQCNDESIDQALYVAAIYGHANIVKIIVPYGSSYGISESLSAASYHGVESTIETIVLANRGTDVVNTQGPLNPLSMAAKQGHLSIVAMLVKLGADVNLRGISSSMIEAAVHGHWQIVQFLIEAGADIDVLDEHYRTPLCVACFHKQVTTVKLLLEHGANVMYQSADGQSPFHWLSRDMNPDHLDTEVLDDNADRRIAIAKLLIESGGDINRQDREGVSPLIVAYEQTWNSLAEGYLKLGANANTQDHIGSTPLMIVLQRGCSQIGASKKLLRSMKMLLDSGADPNLKTTAGETALSIVLKLALRDDCELTSYWVLVKKLLSKGADPTILNISGDNSIAVAKRIYEQFQARLRDPQHRTKDRTRDYLNEMKIVIQRLERYSARF